MDPKQNNVEPTKPDGKGNGGQKIAPSKQTPTEPEEPVVEPTTSHDLEIKIKALEDIVKSQKEANDKLMKDLDEVKTTNAKLITQIDLTNGQSKLSVEEEINSLFNNRF